MLKIAVVLATTFLFAGLLIAYPYSPDQSNARMARATKSSASFAAKDAANAAQPSPPVSPGPSTVAGSRGEAGRPFLKESPAESEDTLPRRARLARNDQRDPDTFPIDRITDRPSLESRGEGARRDARERTRAPDESPSTRRNRLSRDAFDDSDAAGSRSTSRRHARRRSEKTPAGVETTGEFSRRSPASREDDYEPPHSNSARLLDLIDEELSRRHHRRRYRS
jgi:hypothetical protein